MFFDWIGDRREKIESRVCVGLDPVLSQMPEGFERSAAGVLEFCRWVVEETVENTLVYKPNSAFFEALGAEGVRVMKDWVEWMRADYGDVPILLDAKRGDIGHTSVAYSQFVFEYLGVDGVTLNPYLGREALEPFLSREDKGLVMLCKTSNLGGGEFQDLVLESGEELWKKVLGQVVEEWNQKGNCGVVIGATYPEQLREARGIAGEDMWFLVPGVGKQGGSAGEVVEMGGERVMVNSSRGVIYADKPGEVVRELAGEMEGCG